MTYDVAIVGGGPAGLSAALALGRARKSVLLCDAGPRRNARAARIHNFVTQDGTPPQKFRDVARTQLGLYPNVEVRDARVQTIEGQRGRFGLGIDGNLVEARRVILCTGMLDEAPPIEGFAELWGHSIFQCPYCHGWELRERPWGYLARSVAALQFPILLRSWTDDVTVFTGGTFEVPEELRTQLERAGIRVEAEALTRLHRRDQALLGVELASGKVAACEALFAHPAQHHVELVTALGLLLDDEGFVRVDPVTRETSLPGLYAAGDLTSRMQSAVIAAALGTQAAAMLNHELTSELVSGAAT
jgi:thioredoxin reductase